MYGIGFTDDDDPPVWELNFYTNDMDMLGLPPFKHKVQYAQSENELVTFCEDWLCGLLKVLNGNVALRNPDDDVAIVAYRKHKGGMWQDIGKVYFYEE